MNHPENQQLHRTNCCASLRKFLKRKKQIVIFGYSIPRGIRSHEFNHWLNKGFSQLKIFPGGTSKKLLYYVEPTFKDKKFDAAIMPVGVNDLLKDESQDSV